MKTHPKWQTIVDIAKGLGAGEWAIRKWSQRGQVPPKWQVIISQTSNGAITLDDFANTDSDVAP